MAIFLKTALVALTAGTIVLSSLTAPASASPISPAATDTETVKPTQIRHRRWHYRHRRGAVAAGIAGAIIGATIVSAASRERIRESRWGRHVARCYRAYRSYDEATDTWIDRRGRGL